MNSPNPTEVRFDLYCNICKHMPKNGFDEPCNKCLDEPVREGTKVPVNYEEVEK